MKLEGRVVLVTEDVAGAVRTMTSNEARFVTGTYLRVSGGSLML